MQENNNENLTFHDEAVPEKKKMSKKTIIAICCLVVYAIIMIWSIISMFTPEGSEAAKEGFMAGFNAGENGSVTEDLTSSLAESFTLASILLSVVKFASFLGSIIFGAMALKETKKENLPGKGLALLGIIGPFILILANFTVSVIFAASMLKESGVLSSLNCMEATRCVDSGNGTSKCVYNAEEITCENSMLNEDQYE